MGRGLLRLAIGLLLFRAAVRGASSPHDVGTPAAAPRRRWRAAVKRLWLPALLIAVGALLVVGAMGEWDDKLPGKDFYGFGAQTFPVLLVALAVELRDSKRPIQKGPFITILVALGLGELVAVVALSGTIAEDATTYNKGAGALVAWDETWSQLCAAVVAVALAWAILGLLLIALCSRLASDAPDETQAAPRR
jgi:hypothetical protein